MAFKVIFLSII